jgi:hypothetical protein
LLYSGNLLSDPRQQVFTAANLARIYGINAETVLDLLVLDSSVDLQPGGIP